MPEAVLPSFSLSAPVRSADSLLPANGIVSRCICDLFLLEAEFATGLAAAWRRVVDGDPLASVFQSPDWCMPWYRCYQDEYEPYVVLVEAIEGLVGVVPLAVRRASGEVTFASHTMADYRDIVALPEYRRAVVDQLIACYLSRRFPNPLQIGWSDPRSDTPALVADVCRQRSLSSTASYQPCWRWFPQGEDLKKKFGRIKTHVNYFKRQGDLTFDVITRADDWAWFREEFFRHHSLRQLQAGRRVSFDDPRKRALYDQLFASPEVRLHVTAFRANGRLMAGHIGLIWRNVLLFGAPSIRIEVEQRSPAVILLSWIVQNAADLAIAGFDLTIGDSEFKRRLGNQRVELTMTEVYRRRRPFYSSLARMKAVSVVKRLATSLGGEQVWQGRIKPAAAALAYRRAWLAEVGIAGTFTHGLRRLADAVRRRPATLVASAPVNGVPAPELPAGYEVHENAVEDLLRWPGTSPSVSRALTGCASSFARIRGAGHDLHSLVIGGTLAAWCYSRRVTPEQPAIVDSEPICGPGVDVIYGIYALPGYRVRAVYQALIAHVAHERWSRGALRVHIMTADSDAYPALQRAARDAGFGVTG